MHKGMALIRRLKTARREFCMFDPGDARSRDGEVVSHKNSFKGEFILWICDRKLSSGLTKMCRKRIGAECQD
jgi:hypothetical protein